MRLALLAALVALTVAGDNVALDAEAIAAFVDGHNQIRQEASPGMPNLVWDDALAAAAQEYAAMCQFKHHSGNKYGENIFMAWGSYYSRGSAALIAGEANKSWYSEISVVDAAWSCVSGSPTCGHYSQQVWADTTKIGCAITKNCENGGVLVFCEYDPRGNWG